MAIEIPHMKLSHEQLSSRAIWVATTRTLRGPGWLERTGDRPVRCADAILRAKRATEDGQTALLEFVTSAEMAFSHRNGGAA